MKTSLNLPRSDFSWRLGTPATQYENPWMRADKTPAVHRELREETGFCANRIEQILTLELSNSFTDERCHVFLATGLTAGETEPESSEDVSLLKISLDAALEAVDAGEIRQALSVAAILKLGRMQAVGHLHGR